MKSWSFFVLPQTFCLIMKTAVLMSFLFACEHGMTLEEAQTLINNTEEEAVETQRVLQEMANESENLVKIFKTKGPIDPELLSLLQKVKQLAILALESSEKVVQNGEKAQIAIESIQESKLVAQKTLKLLEKVEAAEQAVEKVKDMDMKKISEEEKNDDLDAVFESVMRAYKAVTKLMIYTQSAADLPVTNILISN